MTGRISALASLLLAGCTTAAAPTDSAAQELAAIAFDINSWGRPISSWEVHADGAARHVRRVSDEGASLRTYRLEHRAFTVAPADFARLAAMAAGLPQPRPNRADCQLRAADLPYGTLRLKAEGAEEAIAFDIGCQDEPYQAFVRQLRSMDALVTGWAEAHPPEHVEHVAGG